MLKNTLNLSLLIGSTFALIQSAHAQQYQGLGSGEDLPRHELTHLTGDLYRFRQIRDFGLVAVTSDGIIVVDPMNTEMATWLKAELDERFGVPVKYVIYSHHHNDHASGGEVFADTATFVGHENMLKNMQMPAADAPLNPRQRLWDANGDGLIQLAEAVGTSHHGEFDALDTNRDGGLSHAEMWMRRSGGNQVPPDITYSDRASITLGGKTVELHYTGRNHTDDMTLLLFPEERVIHVVDYLTPKRPPAYDIYGGFFPDWLESLRQVEELDFDIISTGHELPGTKADAVEQRRYMEDLIAAVQEGIAAGRSEQELVDTILMEDYDHLIEFEEHRAGNVVGVYQTLIAYQ
jgi:glyoxylase-like metal-dependent hydrolase (beta-lactamase superfamily II)